MQSSPDFALFRGKRDYRAVVFTCPGLETISQIVALIGGFELKNDELATLDSGMIKGARIRYQSKECFLRSADEQKRALLRLEGKFDCFEYELCILSRRQKSGVSFLLAVPFSGMAREVFGKIHEKKPHVDFRYLRPDLDRLLASLIESRPLLSKIRVVGINWSIAGDSGRAKQITIRGTDIVNSSAFHHVRSESSIVQLTLQKVQIFREGAKKRPNIKITFDKFGNYGIWAESEAGNFPDIFKLIDLLFKERLIEFDSAFPVRNQVEEPLMP